MVFISQNAVDIARKLIERFEGFEPNAYQNKHDVPTIGYGHTRGVKLGMVCTQVQADQWLEDDLQAAIDDVCTHVLGSLTDNQGAALLDFTFNLGAMNLNSSTLLRDIDTGDLADAPAQFVRWVHDSAGEVLPGLVTRRQAEATLFTTPDVTTA